MHVGINLAGWGVQTVLEEIPNLKWGYGMNALREACEVDPEFGAVLACCSLALEEASDQNEGEKHSASVRWPEWTGAVEAPDLYEGGVLPPPAAEGLLKPRGKLWVRKGPSGLCWR